MATIIIIAIGTPIFIAVVVPIGIFYWWLQVRFDWRWLPVENNRLLPCRMSTLLLHVSWSGWSPYPDLRFTPISVKRSLVNICQRVGTWDGYWWLRLSISRRPGHPSLWWTEAVHPRVWKSSGCQSDLLLSEYHCQQMAIGSLGNSGQPGCPLCRPFRCHFQRKSRPRSSWIVH